MINKKLKKIIAIGAAVVICMTAGGVYAYSENVKKNAVTVSFTPVTVKKQNMDITVSASGSVSNASQIDLAPASSGTLDTLNVKQGDTVTQGEVLAHVNDTSAEQSVQTAQNNLNNQEQNLAKAKAGENNLYTKAPVSGIVKNLNISAGDDVSNYKSLGSLLTISEDGNMKVSIQPGVSVSQGEGVYVNINGHLVSGTVNGTSSGSKQGMSQGGVTVVFPDGGYKTGTTVTVYKSDKSTVVGSGDIDINEPVQVSGPQSGTITNVYVSENSRVNKGSNLFKLDGSDVESNINTQNNAVTQAQNDLSQKQDTLAKNTLTSPVNGTVAAVNYSKGDSVSQGKAVLTVFDPTQMQAVVQVDELDISKVKLGQNANITLDAITGKTFSGTVTKIASIGTISNNVTTYTVTVSINNPSDIMIGMTANVNIITQSKPDALVVPVSAVQGKGNNKYVYLAKGLLESGSNSSKGGFYGRQQSQISKDIKTQSQALNTLKKNIVYVQTGLSNQNYIEITSGVSEGDKLVIPIYKQTTKSTTNSSSNMRNSSGYGSSFGGGFGSGGGFSGGSRNSSGGNGGKQ